MNTIPVKAPPKAPLGELCREAARLRDESKGRRVTFSPKVFIPLTQLCRDFCSYCTFRRRPGRADPLYLEADEVLSLARAGEKLGCREALFVLGERPEERFAEARDWLRARGFDSTVEYLHAMCRLVLEETSLLPHSNAGNLTRAELRSLRRVNVSLGLMLENISPRLLERGGPHERAPSKRPEARLRTLEEAGRLRIPFTTGLLVGIGETGDEREASLQAIADLQQRFGHIQEVIIQNFRAKERTPMAGADEIQFSEMLETVARARLVLGGAMNLQVPPNLSLDFGEDYSLLYLKAGINDWGGISPVTIDHVNPEAPWPHLGKFARRIRRAGFAIKARYPVYPEFFLNRADFVDPALRRRLLAEGDSQGLVPEEVWRVPELFPGNPAGRSGEPPETPAVPGQVV